MTADQTVFIVDDDDAVRDSLRMLLTLHRLRVAVFASGEEFLDAYRADWSGCVLLDLRMPGIGGLEVQQRLKQRGDNPPLIILTAHGDVASARAALKAGAVDFLEKPIDDHVLIDVIEQALQSDQRRRDAAQRMQQLRERGSRLTTRERQVMALLAEGRHNRDIGAALAISPRTVEIYKSRMMEKLQARSLADVIRIHLAENVDPNSRGP